MIEDPMIEVVTREDGLALFEAIEMNAIGSIGSYRHDEDDVENRIVNGEATLVIISAAISGNARSSQQEIRTLRQFFNTGSICSGS